MTPKDFEFQSRRDPGMSLRVEGLRAVIARLKSFNPVVIRACRCAATGQLRSRTTED